MNKRALAAALGLALVGGLALVSCSADNRQWGQEQQEDGPATVATEDGYLLQEEGTLKVAAALDYMPFEGESGFKTVGFAYDLMGLVADKLGLTLEYVSSPSQDRVIAAVEDGTKVDVGVSSLEPSAELSGNVIATDSYLNPKMAVSARRDSDYADLSQLDGQKVGVVAGSTEEAWAQENLPDCELVEFDDFDFLFAGLQSCNVEAVVANLETSWYYLEVKYTNEEVIYQEDSDMSFVMVVANDNQALADAINEALQALRDDGSYQDLYDSWFHETAETVHDSDATIPDQGAAYADKAA